MHYDIRLPQGVDAFSGVQADAAVRDDSKARYAPLPQFHDFLRQLQLEILATAVLFVEASKETHRRLAKDGASEEFFFHFCHLLYLLILHILVKIFTKFNSKYLYCVEYCTGDAVWTINEDFAICEKTTTKRNERLRRSSEHRKPCMHDMSAAPMSFPSGI